MRRESKSRLPARHRRLPLRFEALENRVQPNDMLGLGAPLLASWGVLDFAAPVEPAEIVREVELGDNGLLVEAGSADAQPFEFHAEARPEQLDAGAPVAATGAEQVFGAVNAQTFGDDLAGDLARNSRLEGLRQRILSTLRTLDVRGAAGALGIPAPGAQALGRGGPRAARTGGGLVDQLQASLLVALNRLSQKAGTEQGGPETQGAFVRLFEGATSIAVNTYGAAGYNSPGCAGIGNPGQDGFRVAGAGNLCEHQDYFSAGGPVRLIGPMNCTVDIPIQTAGDNVGISAVTCSGTTVLFIQYVDGATQQWFTIPIVYSQQPVCYYAYSDYDITAFANNGGSYQAPQFVVRNNDTQPNIHFTYSGVGLQSHWEQDEFDDLKAKIMGFQSCMNLANASPIHNGDWTGAFQFNLPANPNEGSLAIYIHGRDDSTPFP